jgi:hypothetical protein
MIRSRGFMIRRRAKFLMYTAMGGLDVEARLVLKGRTL